MTPSRITEYRNRHRAAGLCLYCSRILYPGDRNRCEVHRKTSNERAKNRANERAAAGHCAWAQSCRRKLATARHCKLHAARFNELHKERNRLLKAAGICLKCSSPALPDSVFCEPHLKMQRMANRVRQGYQGLRKGRLKGGRKRKSRTPSPQHPHLR